MKPIILVTAGVENTQRGLVQTTVYKTYSEAIANSGGIPLIVGDDSDLEAMADLADGLCITGGFDVDARMYHGNRELCGAVDLWRDSVESGLARLFIERKKPILGICRGMQMLNVVLGGTLYEDIYERLGYQHPFLVPHKVTAKPGSVLADLFGKSFEVNSFHHQSLNVLGDGLEVTAWTKEHIVEGIAHKTLPILGVQWHPERMTGKNPYTPVGPDMKPLYDVFIGMCSSKKVKRAV